MLLRFKVLAGDVDPAIRTHDAFFSVWKKYGFTPEGFNLATSTVQNGQRSYPLRPELIESTYWLFKATRDYRCVFLYKVKIKFILTFCCVSNSLF